MWPIFTQTISYKQPHILRLMHIGEPVFRLAPWWFNRDVEMQDFLASP